MFLSFQPKSRSDCFVWLIFCTGISYSAPPFPFLFPRLSFIFYDLKVFLLFSQVTTSPASVVHIRANHSRPGMGQWVNVGLLNGSQVMGRGWQGKQVLGKLCEKWGCYILFHGHLVKCVQASCCIDPCIGLYWTFGCILGKPKLPKIRPKRG